jgi:hypothetical protein
MAIVAYRHRADLDALPCRLVGNQSLNASKGGKSEFSELSCEARRKFHPILRRQSGNKLKLDTAIWPVKEAHFDGQTSETSD